jgi:oxygen-independent coproporphyrinogen III oxidase
MPQMVDAICKEIELQKNYLNNQPLKTIYFGGGTPGILSINQLQIILETIAKHFNSSQVQEVTAEVNPDDMTLDKLIALKQIGVNRLSIGVQSFFEEDLLYMNRAHNSNQALQCIKDAHACGFNNLSADLIYGYPLLTDSKWQQNLNTLLQLQIPHLSCYSMTVEPQTALSHFISKGKESSMNTDQSANQFEYLMQWAKANGYEHYEISNFAAKGNRAVHNSNYWQYQPYLGVGPSASSFNGVSRQTNVANNAEYIKKLNNNQPTFTIEQLTRENNINEYIMISLRTIEGINLNQLKLMMNEVDWNNVLNYVQANPTYFILQPTTLALTQQGKLMTDAISLNLFVEE